MADTDKKPWTVVQEGRDGAPLEIYGQNYKKNDTIWLTEGEGKYLLGLSIERGAGNLPEGYAGIPGEHRESGADIVPETRPMKDAEVYEDDVRSEKRQVRSPVIPKPTE